MARQKEQTNQRTQCFRHHIHALVNRFHIRKYPVKRTVISTLESTLEGVWLTPTGYACVQGQLAFVQVVVSHPFAPIEMDWVKAWTFEISYAWAVVVLPVSMMRREGRRMSQRNETG